jgi:hypothetical protein
MLDYLVYLKSSLALGIAIRKAYRVRRMLQRLKTFFSTKALT